MTNLSVNVNKIAWLRNARNGDIPNLKQLCEVILGSGSSGITVHPRPDLRHITPKDVKDLATLTNKYSKELNIEGNPFSKKSSTYDGFIELIKIIKPTQCTLVPDMDNQITSDHGWDLTDDTSYLEECIDVIKGLGCRVSLFLDPQINQIEKAKKIGADRVELYTGPYAKAYELDNFNNRVLEDYKRACKRAIELELDVNAGHDLNLKNLKKFLTINEISEVSIGQALISDALIYGLENTIKKYLSLCE
jgi:pyridoxine 5-phosphate synthase